MLSSYILGIKLLQKFRCGFQPYFMLEFNPYFDITLVNIPLPASKS